jgi:hypothetical protein
MEKIPQQLRNEKKVQWHEELVPTFKDVYHVTTPTGLKYQRWEETVANPLRLHIADGMSGKELKMILEKEFPGHGLEDFQLSSAPLNNHGSELVITLLEDDPLYRIEMPEESVTEHERPPRSQIDDVIVNLKELQKRSREEYLNRHDVIVQMSRGGNPEGDRVSAYPGWSDEDFLEVLKNLT